MPLGSYNHTLNQQRRLQDQRESLENYQDRTSNLVEGIRDSVGPGSTGVQNLYTKGWDTALQNAQQGAGDYLTAMQNGQGSVMQAQQNQGLGTLQAGMGNGTNRNAYMNAANQGSQGLAATSMGRAGETNQAMGNYGNAVFGVGAGYGGQASFQQAAQQAANDQALQQQNAYMGKDASDTSMGMNTAGSIAGAIGAGAMMMSDARAKEEAYKAGKADGISTYSSAEVAKARGVPMLDPEHYYPNIKNTNPLGQFHYGDTDPQDQTSPTIAKLAQIMGVDPKNVGRDLEGNDTPLRMLPKVQPQQREDPQGFSSPWNKMKSREQGQQAWNRAVKGLGEISVRSMDDAKAARANAIGLGSGELGSIPVTPGTVDAPNFAPAQATPEILDRYRLPPQQVQIPVQEIAAPLRPTLESIGNTTDAELHRNGFLYESDARAKVLEKENAVLKSVLQKSQYSVGPGGQANFQTPSGRNIGTQVVNVPEGTHVQDSGPGNWQAPLKVTQKPLPNYSNIPIPGDEMSVDRTVEGWRSGGELPTFVAGNDPKYDAWATELTRRKLNTPTEEEQWRAGGELPTFMPGDDPRYAAWENELTRRKINAPETTDTLALSDMGVKKAATPRLKKELYQRGEMAVDSDIGRAHDDIMKALKPHAYSYKDNADPRHIGALPAKQVRPGITAQELEKSELGKALVINTPKGKMIDIPALTGANSAMIARLYEHISKLEGRHGP